MKTIRDQGIIGRLLARLSDVERIAMLDALLARAMPIPFAGCYAWMGWETGNGFGNVEIEGRTIKVHRLTWCLKNNATIPPGHVQDHSCRVRRCINPEHTSPVTVLENTLRGSAVLYCRAA